MFKQLLAEEAAKSTDAISSALKDKEKLQVEAESHNQTREALIEKAKDMEKEVKRLNDVSSSSLSHILLLI